MLRSIALPQLADEPLVGFHSAGWAACKRLFDLVVGTIALLIVMPLLAVVALAIMIDSPGNPFFIQTRVGQFGRPFRLIKLRTMVPNAEQMRAQLEHLNESKPPLFKLHNDPRLTRLGAFLRASSMDELPQLLNVILGDMSLVGPRPRMPAELAGVLDRPDIQRRLSAKPGLAGVWQVNGRAQNEFDEALALDLFYIDHWSFFFDLQLIVRTFLVVLSARGAC
jgi:lipopolysaccharide/colanic/teichoic acid biosynthesis glycosyltransferase